VRIVDKKTVNVSFDAKIIGARALIGRAWHNGPIRFAPLRDDEVCGGQGYATEVTNVLAVSLERRVFLQRVRLS
jgi:hypothetical protein